MIEWAAFLVLAAVALAGALGMLLTMSMYRAAIFLMSSFVALAGIFVLLGADLLAAIQVMMNVGGMLVMLLFMVPLMMDPGGEMMWDMKRKMHLPGLAALSMAMPRQPPPPEPETPHPGGPARPAPTDWTCPMHPEVSSTGPGKCPKCGMDLVPRAELGGAGPGPVGGTQDAAAGEAPAAGYTCPMHPEVRSDQPGECPKCGMALVPAGAAGDRFGQASHSPSGAASTNRASGTRGGAGAYACPMHPEVTSDRPGRCPKCGMDLVPVEVPPPDEEATQGDYTCPMHPEVRSDEPGKCPKCGMELVPTGRSGQEAAAYTCPMHPDVRSDTPGRCPRCGMDLGPAGQPAGAAGHEGMPMGGGGGTVRMSPAQHHRMMVDMAMSTELLPWAMGIGAAAALLVGFVLARASWPLAPTGPSEDAVVRVGELLLSRYMIAFEGAAYLILAGIVGAVVLAKRERDGGPEEPASAPPHDHGGHA